MNATPQEMIRARCREVINLAKNLYSLDLSKVDIRFDLRGRCAGMAHRRGNYYYVRFNNDMLSRDSFDHVLNDTVPHELAHIVCFMKPKLGNNHDAGWASVCRALGGSGDRCHNEEYVMGKGTTYEYVTDRGHRVRIGDRHHNYLQVEGGHLNFRRGMGKITRNSAYSIVGVNGRSLPNPIVKNPYLTAAEIAEDIRKPPTAKPTVTNTTHTESTAITGQSKAAISRRIMLSGHTSGRTYEEIIAAMMAACGYDRQLARATYRANAAKVGVPVV